MNDTTENLSASVWACRRDHWNDFLNDPDIAAALNHAKTDSATVNEALPDDAQVLERGIRSRLSAFDTPVTQDILRQSIR